MVFTFTSQVAFAFGLSTDVTVIVVVPNPFAVIVPLLTVTTDSLSECQVTFLFVASVGNIVGVKVLVSPTAKVTEVSSNETLVT